MLIGTLSNNKTRDGVTGLAVYNNKGEFLSAHPIPAENGGDGYGYDIAINPKKNVFLTSSFTGWNNYMMDLGKLIKDAEAMKHFGNTMVLWDLKALKPEKIFSVPGAPLEIRWSLNEGDDWAITASALTSKLWLVSQDANNAVAGKGGRRQSAIRQRFRCPSIFRLRPMAKTLMGQHLHGRHDPSVRS